MTPWEAVETFLPHGQPIGQGEVLSSRGFRVMDFDTTEGTTHCQLH